MVPLLDPSPLPEAARALIADLVAPSVPRHQQVFVNRNLRLGGIEAIGFDMDYTIAEYTPAMETLQVRMTLERLIATAGYPKAVLERPYDPAFAIRGLVIDKQLGNILKADAHRHISRGLHGFRQLPKEERRALYRTERVSMRSDRYALVDTAFAVPETWLFAHLVDLEDSRRRPRRDPARYRRIYDDIRVAIDTIHADETLKTVIRADIGTYIRRDPALADALLRVQGETKRLFLLTNSLGNYTEAVMRHLLDGLRQDRPSWRDYFAAVVVGARKPSFFSSTDHTVALDDAFRPTKKRVRAFERGTLYQGGHRAEFEQLLGAHGDRILYVGDHIYGDILRSKTHSAWRTLMIVPELEAELARFDDAADAVRRRDALDARRRTLDAELHRHEELATELEARGHTQAACEAAVHVREHVVALREALRSTLAEIFTLNETLYAGFNPHFGMLFKAHDEHSLIGEQIEDYACLYTSRVANLVHVSPVQYFRAPRDLLPHELTHEP